MTTATTVVPPSPSIMETVSCYYCGETESTEFIIAQDDLTGKPGDFHFVTCESCGLVFQNPRVDVQHIKDYYDDEYIAHRKKTRLGHPDAIL